MRFVKVRCFNFTRWFITQKPVTNHSRLIFTSNGISPVCPRDSSGRALIFSGADHFGPGVGSVNSLYKQWVAPRILPNSQRKWGFKSLYRRSWNLPSAGRYNWFISIRFVGVLDESFCLAVVGRERVFCYVLTEGKVERLKKWEWISFNVYIGIECNMIFENMFFDSHVGERNECWDEYVKRDG